VKENFEIFQEKGLDYLKAYRTIDEEEEVVAAIYQPHIDGLDEPEGRRVRGFKDVYYNRIYETITCLIDILIMFIPIIKLDTFDKNKPSNNWYLTSEVLTFYVFLEAAMIVYTLPKERSTTTFKIRVISSVITFASANYLEYVKYDIGVSEIYAHTIVFKIWAVSSIMKIISIHKILKHSSRWCSVLNGIRQVVPMLQDLLMIYFVILLIFCIIGTYMFGGKINSKFNPTYNAKTGNDMNANWDFLNFNDTLNSFLFLFALTVQSGWSDMMQMAIISGGPSKSWHVAGYIYFVLYFFLGILITLNIILGMVLSFIGVYLGNCEEKEMEKESTKIAWHHKLFRTRPRVEGNEE